MKLKSVLYEKEQNELIDKIITVLDLNKTNQITLYELENDENKIKGIMDLTPELRKYFSFSSVHGLENPEKMKRPWLSIIRQVTKQKYTMKGKDYQINQGKNVVIRTQIYTFTSK